MLNIERVELSLALPFVTQSQSPGKFLFFFVFKTLLTILIYSVYGHHHLLTLQPPLLPPYIKTATNTTKKMAATAGTVGARDMTCLES